jgi:hypothetical protein
MQDSRLFEYAVVRVVPRVEREEFVNVGVILLCRKQDFLQAMFSIDAPKLLALCPILNIAEIEENLNAIAKICKGGKESGPIGMLATAERFRWLTATRSTIVQTSKVHPGFGTDPQEALQRLFEQMVL